MREKDWLYDKLWTWFKHYHKTNKEYFEDMGTSEKEQEEAYQDILRAIYESINTKEHKAKT